MEPMSAKPWLITISTYGQWLPGNPRGFQAGRSRLHVPSPRRSADPGERTYDPDEFARLHEWCLERPEPSVRLTRAWQKAALDAIAGQLDDLRARRIVLP